MRSCSSANTAGSTYAARCTAPSLTRSMSEGDGEAQVPLVLVRVQQVDALRRDEETVAARPQAPARAPGEPALLAAGESSGESSRSRRSIRMPSRDFVS